MCLDVRRRPIAEGERTSEKKVMRESKGLSSLGWLAMTVCAAIPPTPLGCGPIYLCLLLWDVGLAPLRARRGHNFATIVDATADTDVNATADTDADATADTDADATADTDTDAGAGTDTDTDTRQTRTQRRRSRRSFTLGQERSVTHQ